jgi:hypothetical protein
VGEELIERLGEDVVRGGRVFGAERRVTDAALSAANVVVDERATG